MTSHWLEWPLSNSLEIINAGDQIRSVTQLCPTLCNPMDCSMPGFPVYHQLLELLKLMSFESVIPSNHLILCHPLLLLPFIFPSIRVFSSESALGIRWPGSWSFSFSISHSDVTTSSLSILCQWHLVCLYVFGYCEQCCSEHWVHASFQESHSVLMSYW